MTNLGNKEILSKNLRRYIEKSGKERRELADIWGFPYSTVTEWVNGRKYPRIDRIEIMADYFGILKSDLIEDKSEELWQMKKNNNAIADIVVRMRTDEKFMSIVEKLNALDEKKLLSIGSLLDTFVQ